MLVPNRNASFDNEVHRYGFNGKEKDDEISGEGNSIDYGMRVYNSRIGRFQSSDPLIREYPELSPYQFANGNPIWALDVDGAEGLIANPGGGQNVVSADMAKSAIDWFYSPASLWMKRGLAAQMNSIQESDVYTVDDFADLTKGEYIFASMAQAQISRGSGFSSPNVRMSPKIKLPQTPKVAADAPKPKPKLQVGTYQEMVKANRKSGLSSDHIPSFAAIKMAAESSLNRELTVSEIRLLRKTTLTVVYRTKIHETSSRTFGGRNSKEKIVNDSKDLYQAAQNDIESLTPALLKDGYSQTDINDAKRQVMAPYANNKQDD